MAGVVAALGPTPTPFEALQHVDLAFLDPMKKVMPRKPRRNAGPIVTMLVRTLVVRSGGWQNTSYSKGFGE